MPRTPELEFAFEARVQIGAPLDLGVTRAGHRRVIPILGGTFEGPRVRGRVLPGGADWQILHADGAADLEARYTLETDSGALLYAVNRGLRRGDPAVLARLNAGQSVDSSLYYFRTVALFESSAPECEWLTAALFAGSGERHADHVVIGFWRML
jgi:hypothetical protein